MKKETENNFNNFIGLYLRHLSNSATTSSTQSHLDEDVLTSFVEGQLKEREAKPILSHLVGCPPCRKITANLARLSSELEDSVEVSTPVKSENRLQAFFGSFVPTLGAEEAVLAHKEPDGEADENAADATEKAEEETK